MWTTVKLFLNHEDMLREYFKDLELYKQAVREYKSKLDNLVEKFEDAGQAAQFI